MAEIVSAKLIENAVHPCVDMKRVLYTVIGMTARYPERTIFTRYDAKLGREASVEW